MSINGFFSSDLRVGRLSQMLGMAGVSSNENRVAQKWGQIFNLLVMLALLLVLVEFVVSFSAKPLNAKWVTLLVWFVFVLEFMGSLLLVDNKWQYVQQNWLSVFIILAATPWIPWQGDWSLIFRALRFLLLFRIFGHLVENGQSILLRNRFGMVLLVSLFFVVFAGALFSTLESISFADGLWYALVTVTTVGYGDVTPKTENGRIFGAFLILFGVVLFSMVTANIAAFIIGAEQKRREQEILHYVRAMGKRLEAESEARELEIERILAHVTEKVDFLEANMKLFNGNKISEEIHSLERNIKAFNQNLTTLNKNQPD